MLRRSLLRALSALPALPVERITRREPEKTAAPAFQRENDLWFWYCFYSAVCDNRAMSTESSREHAIDEMDLTTLSEDEAHRVLEGATNGEFGLGDIPDRWRAVFDRIPDRLP